VTPSAAGAASKPASGCAAAATPALVDYGRDQPDRNEAQHAHPRQIDTIMINHTRNVRLQTAHPVNGQTTRQCVTRWSCSTTCRAIDGG
jgi:hypothetical protein